MSEDLAALLDRLESLSLEIRDQTRPFARLGEDGYGFADLPLENDLAACAGLIAAQLKATPEFLTAPALERILSAPWPTRGQGRLLLWPPAIRHERVRLVAYGGDYGDIMSPLSYVALQMFAALRQTLRGEACAGAHPLAAADPRLLRRRLSFERDWSLLDLLTGDPEA